MSIPCQNKFVLSRMAISARVEFRQAGLTLLELMISLTLGLLLIVGIGTVFVGSNQTYRVQEENARIQESGRFALDIIGRSLRQAGYWNMPISPIATQTGFGGTPINGLNNLCPTAAPATDAVTVQYDGTAGEEDCQGDNIAAGEYVQHTLFLENNALRCDAIRTASPTLPTLPVACPAAGSGVELVSNVEDLQLLYGIDTNADQSADSYTATPANWNQVVSARACILIRSEQQGISTSAQSYLNCAGALGTVTGASALTTAGDTRLRRTFVATFNLRNRVTNLP